MISNNGVFAQLFQSVLPHAIGGKGPRDRPLLERDSKTAKSQGELKRAIGKKAPVLKRLPEAEEERPNKGHCADNGPVGLPGAGAAFCPSDIKYPGHNLTLQLNSGAFGKSHLLPPNGNS